MTTKEAKKAETAPSGKKSAPTAPKSEPPTDQAHTLRDVAEGYMAHLEQRGMSLMSRASYENDLKLALRELGEKTKLSALSKKKVENYFESPAVCQTRTGRAKAEPTVAKARRVLRLSLCWAQEAGWIAEVPVPDEYLRCRGGTKKAQPKKEQSKATTAKA